MSHANPQKTTPVIVDFFKDINKAFTPKPEKTENTTPETTTPEHGYPDLDPEFDLFETLAQAFKPKQSKFILGGEIYSNTDEQEEDPDNYPNENLGRDDK